VYTNILNGSFKRRIEVTNQLATKESPPPPSPSTAADYVVGARSVEASVAARSSYCDHTKLPHFQHVNLIY